MNVAFKTIVFTIVAAVTADAGFSQPDRLIIPKGIYLPHDSAVRKDLIAALNGFLKLKDSANEQNTYVLPAAYLETSAMLDEMKDMETNSRMKNSNFYKNYLTNIVELDSLHFLIQLANIGVNDSLPALRASFELLAGMQGNRFYFSSPLKRNTAGWETKTFGTYTFHYATKPDMAQATSYALKSAAFDKKLHTPPQPTDMYCCKDFPDVLQLTGIQYKSDYNSYANNTLSSGTARQLLVINGDPGKDRFDLHDLWHARLHNAIPVDSINKPVDEACAYLYGGSWGLSWQQILKTFKEKLSNNPQADWLALYESSYNFGESQQRHLIAGYVINALIIQKLEKEKGFAVVREFLTCGKYEKSNTRYFKTLEKLTGINRANFNERVWALVRAA